MNRKPGWGVLGGAVGLTTAMGIGVYAARRQVAAKLLGLRPSMCEVDVHRRVPITMSDGVVLMGDHYRPKIDDPLPTILIRTPYKRRGMAGVVAGFLPMRFAERGYHVFVQDVRGRGDSAGRFEPYVHEATDGDATINWIAQQPWSDGAVGMWGPSYLGFVQWAAASRRNPHLKALFPVITRAQLASLPEHAFELDLILRWIVILDALENEALPQWDRVLRTGWPSRQEKVLASAFDHLPLSEALDQSIDDPPAFYHEWFDHIDADPSYWEAIDFRPFVPDGPPAHFVSGWYDFFCDDLLRDYQLQRGAGGDPYLTIGPWVHTGARSQTFTMADAIDWFDAQLKGRVEALRPNPVQIYVMGAEEWWALDAWPPPTEPVTLFLHGRGQVQDGALHPEMPPPDAQPDTYIYDPAEPTPNVGGALIALDAGPQDNRALEARHDVLTFTTEPFDTPWNLIGAPELVLYVRSSAVSADFFGRLCVVESDGRSINLCDGLFRLEAGRGELQPDGSTRITIPLSSTAYQFQPEQRMRLQVSSGAHPRFARNLGTGGPFADATDMVVAHQTVFHDADRPSALTLPHAS